MGHRVRGIFAIAVATLAVTTACGEGDGGGSSTEDSATTISSADEVIKIVDKGFVTYTVTRPGVESGRLSYGFVIENVSDEVAVNVRVEVSFSDEAGNPVEDASGGNDFSVVLPGQQMGAGRTDLYDGPAIADINVRITLISSLDTPDGKRHRKPPSPYAELKTGNPVAKSNDEREAVTLDVTNTYDVPLTPKASAVVRDADGVIVGGMGVRANPMDPEIPPGGTAQAKLTREVHLPRLTSGTIEYYADPMLGKVITRDPVWQDF